MIAAALIGCASVMYMAIAKMGHSRIVAENAMQESRDMAFQVALRVAAERANEDKGKVYEDCQRNIKSRINSLKNIDLPDDLLKNAVWSVPTSGVYAYADFSYDGTNGSANVFVLDPGTSYAVINYKGKQILASSVVDSYYDSNPLVTPIRDLIGPYFCDLNVSGGEIMVNEKLVVPDAKFDNAPKIIEGPGVKQKAQLVKTFLPYILDADVTTTVAYDNGSIKMMVNPSNGYYVKLTNGKISFYDSYDLSHFASSIKLDGRNEKLGEYDSHRAGGCGTKMLNIVNVNDNELKQIGVASNGDKLYAYTDNEKVRPFYETTYFPDASTNENVTFEKFLADQPYFIWYDGFGMAIQYQKTKYTPAAECGKPVIYLYPEKDMNVSVKVAPNGGFKFTEPTYNNGWNVWASTQSELTNISDGASYPYLFWEGKAYNYDTPNHGFVLKRESVAHDMAILLKRLGLNEKESADFMEFWQPKLEIKPYVYVTFLPQAEFDKLAPLTVTPKPDKVIRVFMDYEPLDHFVSVPPLKITTPTRTGFMVVEWGGRLR